MPRVWKRHKDIIAILCSDIHLSHDCPVARSKEENWYDSMKRGLVELQTLQDRYYDVPIICAGDVFDRWKSVPELINFALDHLPNMLAIPGQHDLPFHSMDDIRKSAYHTLVKAGKIKRILTDGHPTVISDRLWVWGFPWDYAWEKCDAGKRDRKMIVSGSGQAKEECVHLAVVHAYNWMSGKTYPGAPKSGNALKWQRRLSSYTASVFGDNHKGFTFGKHMMNCGTFFRRKIDEIDYQPQVGLLNKWGRIIPHYLDCSQDVFIDKKELAKIGEQGLEAAALLSELSKLGDSSLNFLESIKRFCADNGVDKMIQRIILEAMEKK